MLQLVQTSESSPLDWLRQLFPPSQPLQTVEFPNARRGEAGELKTPEA
jgi:hypothetical protein